MDDQTNNPPTGGPTVPGQNPVPGQPVSPDASQGGPVSNPVPGTGMPTPVAEPTPPVPQPGTSVPGEVPGAGIPQPEEQPSVPEEQPGQVPGVDPAGQPGGAGGVV